MAISPVSKNSTPPDLDSPSNTGEQGGQVAADDGLALVLRHHHSAGETEAQGADGPVAVLRSRRDRLRPFDQPAHSAKRFLKAEAPGHPLFDEVSQDLGVGLRPEYVAGRGEPTPKRQVVLHDAVVNQHDLALAIDVGVGVGVGRAPVGRPAGVPQPQRALGRRAIDGLLQPDDLADGLAQVEAAAVVDDGDSRAVVAPVLKALEPFVDDGPSIVVP